MHLRTTLGFDDRPLIALGVPLLGLFIPVVFQGLDPVALGFAGFAPAFLTAALSAATFWYLARYTVAAWRTRLPQLEQTTTRIVATALTLVAVAVAIEVADAAGIGWTSLVAAVLGQRAPETSLPRAVTFSAAVALSISGAYEAIAFFRRTQSAELDRERLLRTQAELRYEVLTRQVDPHFLFNSLSTLAAVIAESPPRAIAFTEHLAATYRRLLDWKDLQTVTVGQELDALRDFVNLLEVRHEDSLLVEVDVPPALLTARTVPFALQTLVENAVKHNEVSRSRPLRVEVSATADALFVRNGLSPKPTTPRAASTGNGLRNLAERNAQIGVGALVVHDEDGIFEVRLPVQPPTH